MYNKKILYVDDEEIQRNAIKDYLTELGYIVKVCDSSGEALLVLKDEEYPLIITDLEMPGMDGITLCKRIRKVNSKAIIYALSGFVAEFGPEKLEKIGFDGHLCKPVDVNKLETAIEGAFDKIERANLGTIRGHNG